MQQRHAAEGARADAALVFFHLGVGLQMSPQVGAVSKGPVAVGAGERTLTWTEIGRNTCYMTSLVLPVTTDVILTTVGHLLSSQKHCINTLHRHTERDTHTHSGDNEEAHGRLVGSEPD